MNLKGFSIIEKIKFYFRKNKLDIQSIEKLNSDNFTVTENTEFNGTHTGSITVNSGALFILRGTLNGVLHTASNSNVIVFGKVTGTIVAHEIVDIRRTAQIDGVIKSVGIKIQNDAKLKGTIVDLNQA